MGFLSNKIDEQSLKPGDHIYSWRGPLKAYAHHGIFVGDGQVIHFGTGLDPKNGHASINDKLKAKMARMVINSNSTPRNKCPTCNIHLKPKGVTKSCLPCFLDADDLYRYEYGVSEVVLKLKRAGTCTTEVASDVGMILHRAEYLLQHDVGFGVYNLVNRNCEDFALYCRLGFIGTKIGASGQAARLHKVVYVERVEVETLVAKLQAKSEPSSSSSQLGSMIDDPTSSLTTNH